MLAIARGDLDEGEDLSRECFTHGERSVGDLAVVAYRFHRYTLCDFRGRLDEIEPAIDDWVAEYPTRPSVSFVFTSTSAWGSLTKRGTGSTSCQ